MFGNTQARNDKNNCEWNGTAMQYKVHIIRTDNTQ